MVIFSNLTSPCMCWIELESVHHLQLVLSFMTIELVASQLTEELVMWSEPPLSNSSEKNNWDAFIVRAFTFFFARQVCALVNVGQELNFFPLFPMKVTGGSHSLYMQPGKIPSSQPLVTGLNRIDQGDFFNPSQKHICEALPRTLSWAVDRLNKLPEVHVKFPCNLIAYQ